MDLEHEKRLTEVETRSKSNTKRIDELKKRQDDLGELVSTVKILADRESRIEDDLGEIKEDVKEMKEKPGKRWEAIVEKIIFTIVGGIVTYVLVKVGL